MMREKELSEKKKIMLFCIPNAGGSAMMYHTWKNKLNEAIELVPVELAGRGRRFKSPLYETFEEAVNDVYNTIKDYINVCPYAIFGHSMGGSIAYELCKKISKMGDHLPVHTFISGRYPAHVEKDEKIMHKLSDDALLKEIFSYGGVDEELLKNPDYVNFMLKIVRADYKILENYTEEKDNFQFLNDISVMCGKEDILVDDKDLYEWKCYASKECYRKQFKGGHFYLNENPKPVTNYISSILLQYYDSCILPN